MRFLLVDEKMRQNRAQEIAAGTCIFMLVCRARSTVDGVEIQVDGTTNGAILRYVASLMVPQLLILRVLGNLTDPLVQLFSALCTKFLLHLPTGVFYLVCIGDNYTKYLLGVR